MDTDDRLSVLEIPQRRDLHEQIAQNIQRLMTEKRFEAGDQLPSERELAAHLRVSRTTVRTAIRLLEQRGLASTIPGRGTIVTPMGTGPVAEALQRYFTFTRCSLDDLITAREANEPKVAELAATRSTAEERRRLLELIGQLEDAYRQHDKDKYAERDAEFHLTLATCSHNELLVAITTGLLRIMHDWLREQFTSVVTQSAVESHRRVYEAVESRDPVRACEEMKAHIETTRSAFRTLFPESAGTARGNDRETPGDILRS